MKKSFSLFTFLIASAAIVAAEETAYTPLPAPWDFLAVKDQKIESATAFIGDDMIFWNGEGFHTGLQKGNLTLFSIKDIPEEVEVPESPNIYIKYTDAYGNIESSHEADMSDDFMNMEFVESWNSSRSVSCTVNRGGQYTVEFCLAPGLFKEEQQVMIKDEACARIYGTLFKRGQPMSSTLIITGGYPFDAASLKGEHSLDWNLASAESSASVLAEGHETFSLETDKPLIASTATINLDFGTLEPGKYLG